MRNRTALLMLISVFALIACAAPAPNGPSNAAATAAPPTPPTPVAANETPPARSKPAPPMSDPLPPERAPAPAAGSTPVKLNTSCKTDADCTVKDVGNCCGYYPACVNVNSPTDPKAVQAACAKSGMMSVCGFAEISSCQCAQGQCQANSGAVTQ